MAEEVKEQAPGQAEAKDISKELGGGETKPKPKPMAKDPQAKPAKGPTPPAPVRPEEKAEVLKPKPSAVPQPKEYKDKIPSAKERQQMREHIRQLQQKIAVLEDDDDKKMYGEKAGKLMKQLEEGREEIRRGQMWSMFAGAVGQLAAGLWGLKTGVDMSGVQPFSQRGWSDAMDQHQRDIDMKLQELRAQRREAIEEARYKEEKVDREERRRHQRVMEDIYRQREGRAAKQLESQEKRAERGFELREEEMEIKRQSAQDRAIEKIRKANEKVQESVKANLIRAMKEKKDEVRDTYVASIKETLKKEGVRDDDIEMLFKEERSWLNPARWFGDEVTTRDVEDLNMEEIMTVLREKHMAEEQSYAERFAQPPGQAVARGAVKKAAPPPMGKIKVEVTDPKTGATQIKDVSREQLQRFMEQFKRFNPKVVE